MELKTRKRFIALLVIIAILACGTLFAKRLFREKEQTAYITAPAAKADIEAKVLATGTLNAFKTVAVGAQVSGQVKTLHAALGERVKKGQLLAEIDPVLQQNSLRDAGVNRDLKQEVTTHSYDVSGSLSYELDLWGKLTRTRDASSWEAEATDADRANTALSLIGTTASAYWQVAYLNQRIASGEASLAYTEQSLALTRLKHDAGTVTGLDLVQARQSVASQKAALTQLEQQRTAARHALAILFDQAPQHSLPELQELPDGPIPAVEAGLPAGILGRRPDLRAAELRLRETLANVDVAKAGFYPTFTLTGSLGGSSTSLADVLQNPVAALDRVDPAVRAVEHRAVDHQGSADPV